MRTSTALGTGLLGDQLDDGGWNCWTEHGATVSSFDSTICVLEGLLEYERAGGDPRGRGLASAARSTSSSGTSSAASGPERCRRALAAVLVAAALALRRPARLDHFRRTGDAPDGRVAEAVQLVRDKQQPDGTWLLENTHPGETQFDFEDGDGFPSRWNTLRALRRSSTGTDRDAAGRYARSP